MNSPIDVARRSLLQGTLALSAVGAAGAANIADATGLVGRASAQRTVPRDDAAFNVRTIGKLQGDLSGVVTYTWNPGTIYGVIPGSGLPPAEFGRALYRVEGVTQRISRLLEDGSVEERSRNWMFYLDAEADEYLTRWRNPYTGEDIDVPPWRGSPSHSRLTVQGPEVSFGSGFENTSLGKPPTLSFRTLGERTWITRHAATRLTDTAGHHRNELSIDAWVCRTADLLDEHLTHVPSTYTWTSHAEWQPWTRMQGRAGNVIWRIESVVMRDRAALPERFLRHLEALLPGKLDEPLNWSS
ncbi:MAG: DUF1838 domain-containing protein [Sinobacteraceae bacterium]|nr:DUF1838 domain-containing protein [Nevskiaceae bacterium]